MTRRFSLCCSLLFVLVVAQVFFFSNTPTVLAAPHANLNLVQYVNPFIGTDDSNVPNPVGGGAGGSTYPGAVVPLGMVQFSPDTPTASPSGYRYSDTSIEDFSLTHFDGAGCSNNEDLNILPITGSVSTSPGSNWTSYSSAYTKSNESATAGYYKNKLDKYNVQAELTATTRTGMAKFTYPATSTARVLINSSRSATGSRNGSISVSGSQVTGSQTAGGFCGSSKTYQVYFAIQFERAPTGYGTWLGGTVSAGSASTNGTNSGAYLTFDTSTNAVVQMKIALSFVSVANAQQNLSTENAAWDFSAIQTNASSTWNNYLNRVQVSGGGTATDQQKFYTALYHVFQSPNVASDTNGQYMGFDYVVHTKASDMGAMYQNYSGWDIYRSWAALMAMIAPNEMKDIVKSMVLDGQQGGELPKWSQQNQEDFVMTGDPGPIIVSSAYAFGVHDFDTAAALNLMNKSGSVVGATTQGSAIRGRLQELLNNHYISGNASDSLEYSASDFAIAQFAKALGDTSKYNYFSQHSQWWQNVYNAESGYIHYRNSDGSWPWPLNPASQTGYTEGNAAQYTWMVTYNYQSLMNLMGGNPTAIQRLDHLFTQVNAGLSQPYFYIGNEPEHNQPWAYTFAGAAYKTQEVVRRIMTEVFTTGAGGLPGNDDLGATSAYYVWSALGMFPVTPGADTLILHGPQFASETIQLAGGKTLQINGSGAGSSAQYVQSLSVNGASTSRPWLHYSDLANGGTLSFTMGGSPNTSWGSAVADAPPSFNDGFTPPPVAPDLGTNLALNKTTTGSATCAATEATGKAVDGSLMNNSKFCSKASPPYLQVDLGSNQTVGSFVIKHAGLGGESTGFNTGAYNIQLSTDGVNWTTAVNASGLRSSRTYNSIAAQTARYVKLNVVTPSNSTDTAARIYELEVYSASKGANLALNKPATADSSCNTTETAGKAFNGSVSGGNADKWCSSGTTKWLQVDLGASVSMKTFVLSHAGAGGESASWNTKDFTIQVSSDNTNWSTVVSVTGNTANVTTHTFAAVSARYVKLNITTPTNTTDTAARIYELEVYNS